MKIYRYFILAIIVFFMSPPSPAQALLPTHIDKIVPRGGSIILFAINAYQSDRGCTPLQQGAVDTFPKSQLGQIKSETFSRFQDGPCGKVPYNIQVIRYQAGNVAGQDEFELVYFYSYQSGGQERIKVKIKITDRPAPVPTSKNRQAASLAPDEPRRMGNTQQPVNAPSPHEQKSSALQTVKRKIAVLNGQSAIAGFTYHLNPDCTPAGSIHFKTHTPPRTGKIRFVQEKGFPKYPQNDLRSACNQSGAEVYRIVYDAPTKEGKDSFTVEAFYSNGNSRKYIIDVDIK